MTDIRGRFKLKARPNDILVFSYVGYDSREVLVSELINSNKPIALTQGFVMCYDITIISGYYPDDIYDAVDKRAKNPSKLSYDEVDIPPIPPSGDLDDFQEWVQNNIVYSEKMLENDVQGKVAIGFAVDKKGKVTDAKVLVKLSEEADKEALRVLNLSEKWLPGITNGNPIKTTMTISITFGNE